MPKHKLKNIFYCITWEGNWVFEWNLASLCDNTKEKKLSKIFAKTASWKLVLGSFVFAKN